VGLTMTPKNIAVAPDVLEALKERAEAEGRTPDEVANEAIQAGLEQASWAAFVAKGRKYGQAFAYGPEDPEQSREELRNEHGR
jgi:hypothetical protein